MSFAIQRIEDTPSDISQWADVLVSANDNLPADDFRTIMMNTLWPNYNSPAMRKTIQSQLRDLFLKRLPPGSWVSKAVENETGRIAGIAVWVDNGDVSDPGRENAAEAHVGYTRGGDDYWGEKSTAKAFVEFVSSEMDRSTKEMNREVGGRILTLRSISVHPKYQRRGIASLLLKEALQKADEMGASITLKATVDGEKVYSKLGFKHMGVLAVEMPEELRMYATVRLPKMVWTPSRRD